MIGHSTSAGALEFTITFPLNSPWSTLTSHFVVETPRYKLPDTLYLYLFTFI